MDFVFNFELNVYVEKEYFKVSILNTMGLSKQDLLNKDSDISYLKWDQTTHMS